MYMSDLFSVHIRMICGDDTDIPRFYDLVHNKEERHAETTAEIVSRFDPLRRKE